MSLPFGTKVYLEDKTLKKIEDLKFGDKVLSIKIKDEELLNHSNFYYKYAKKDNTGNQNNIKINKLDFCSATVHSIFLHKQKTDFISFNNILLSSTNPILISKTAVDPNEFFLKDSRDIIAKLQNNINNEKYFIQSLAAQSFNIGSDVLNKNIFIDLDNPFLQNEIVDFDLNIISQPAISVVLLDHHFLLTENLISFGSIVGDDLLL